MCPLWQAQSLTPAGRRHNAPCQTTAVNDRLTADMMRVFHREKAMTVTKLDRRTMLSATGAFAAATMLPRGAAMAQGAAPGTPPPRAEFVIRGAYVLPMDPSIADLPTGDVHVRDGTIIAVAPRIEAPSAISIDGKGMICMPG